MVCVALWLMHHIPGNQSSSSKLWLSLWASRSAGRAHKARLRCNPRGKTCQGRWQGLSFPAWHSCSLLGDWQRVVQLVGEEQIRAGWQGLWVQSGESSRMAQEQIYHHHKHQTVKLWPQRADRRKSCWGDLGCLPEVTHTPTTRLAGCRWSRSQLQHQQNVFCLLQFMLRSKILNPNSGSTTVISALLGRQPPMKPP